MSKIVDYVKTATVAANIYAEDVAALIEAGEGKATVVTVLSDTVNEAGKSTHNIAGAKRAFQNAARDAGKSARVVETLDDGNGNTDITFILSGFITRTTKPVATETATDAEYVAPAKPTKG